MPFTYEKSETDARIHGLKFVGENGVPGLKIVALEPGVYPERTIGQREIITVLEGGIQIARGETSSGYYKRHTVALESGQVVQFTCTHPTIYVLE